MTSSPDSPCMALEGGIGASPLPLPGHSPGLFGSTISSNPHARQAFDRMRLARSREDTVAKSDRAPGALLEQIESRVPPDDR